MAKMSLAVIGIVVVSAAVSLHGHIRAAEGPAPAATGAAAAEGAADEKAPPELIDALKKIASGDLALDKFDFSAFYMSGGLTGAQFKVGDPGPSTKISIHKGTVTVMKSVVSELQPVGSASIPTFSTHAVVVDATEAEVRRIASLLLDAGVGAPVLKGFSWKSDERKLRVDVAIGDKLGTLNLNLLKPEENKRAEELLKLLNDFNGRPEKAGAGK
jgi:hypothetical protein